MKSKHLLLISLVCFMVVAITVYAAFAVDTTLTTPLVITPSATKMKQYSVTLIPSENKVRANLRFVDANGATVQDRECEFTDSAVVQATITAGKVGQKYIDVIAGAVQTKCKGLWNLTGTDN